MHISEGVLTGPVLVSSGVLAAAGTAVGLKSLDYDRIAQVGLLSACFFVASLIHVPVGPGNVHLVLNGLLGVMLGWAAFPAIATALVLQAVFFQFGGITTLGVNTLIMALPAVLCGLVFRPMIRKHTAIAGTAAFFCGFLSVLMGALIAATTLVFTGEAFTEIAYLLVIAHIPVMIVEGIVTMSCVAFVKKVKPDMLPGLAPGDSAPQSHQKATEAVQQA